MLNFRLFISNQQKVGDDAISLFQCQAIENAGLFSSFFCVYFRRFHKSISLNTADDFNSLDFWVKTSNKTDMS